MDAFTGAAFTGTAFAGAAYIQRCKKPAQALPCLGRPTETGSLGAGMCKCKRSAPFSTQNLDHLITQVVGSAATASQLALQPQSLPEVGRAADLQPANGKPGWKGSDEK